MFDRFITLLTTGQAARLVQVHESTVKRWCDKDELPCLVTSGGHRRIALESLLRFADEQDIESTFIGFGDLAPTIWEVTNTARKSDDFGPLQDISYDLVQRREGMAVSHLIQFLREQELTLPTLCDDVLAPVAWCVGEEWQRGAIGVGDEHFMTQLLMECIDLQRDRKTTGANGPARTAVVGCGGGNEHELGARMVRLVLEQSGWEVIYLGGRVPAVDLAKQQQKHDAELVCVSLVPPQVATDARRLTEAVAAHYNESIPYRLVLGGSAFRDSDPIVPNEYPFVDLRVFNRIAPFDEWLSSVSDRSQSDG